MHSWRPFLVLLVLDMVDDDRVARSSRAIILRLLPKCMLISTISSEFAFFFLLHLVLFQLVTQKDTIFFLKKND